MCDVKTGVVTEIEIHDRHSSDVKLMPAVVDASASNFPVAEVSEDKGYATARNTEAVMNHGGTPYIAFRTSDTGWTGGASAKMFGHVTYRATSSCSTTTSGPTSKPRSA